MQKIITVTEQRFGTINGVIHAAGVPSGALIPRWTQEMTEKVFSPKGKGTLVLDSLLQNMELDFFILCSSLASVLGIGGQIGYCAANAFLDAFAHFKKSKGDSFTVAINWDTWQEVGMAVEIAQNHLSVLTQGIEVRQQDKTAMRNSERFDSEVETKDATVTNLVQQHLKEGLLPTEGVEVFNRILGSTQSQILISTRKLQSLLEQNYASTMLSTMLNSLKEGEQTRLSQPTHSRPQLSHAYVAPRNELEQKLADIWQTFLGIEQVGIFDNFFDLGGNSLLAVQLVAKLREAQQMDFSAHSLLNAPTIAALVKLIEETNLEFSNQPAEQALPSILVEIQTGNCVKSPLFLMHPVGGHVYLYRYLAHHLGAEQPVYGLQAQGLDGETEPLSRIEEMATQYIEAMRVVQPEGPYLLGGTSFGGTVAFEMAQQLHVLGQKVALLALIDTPSHLPPEPLQHDVDILAYLLNVGSSFTISDQFYQLSKEEQLRYFLVHGKIANKLFPDVTLEQLRHFLHLFKVNVQAMQKYRPQSYPGQIIFFRASEQTAYNPQNPERGWIDVAAGGVEVYDVPGNHITMNHPPHVEVIAKRLMAYLDEVLE
jgi:thioesterase domain-containing protein/acyl carrier protein